MLEEERQRGERLLLNILPGEVATILKREHRVPARLHPAASVLFADVVGFTPISADMPPEDLVELLNQVFSAFDDLVEKLGLEKIKTIGDCYMAAGGVPHSRADHAQAVVQLALEMRELVASREFLGRRLQFRIGVHSGPLVAGVIGQRKFIYDLWGDTVNTASRMESHGQGGAIQITEATHELIGKAFRCAFLGSIPVKGKGEMNVWEVIGRAPSCPGDPPAPSS